MRRYIPAVAENLLRRVFCFCDRSLTVYIDNLGSLQYKYKSYANKEGRAEVAVRRPKDDFLKPKQSEESMAEEKQKISKERTNEIAYALLLVVLSKDPVKLDPAGFKRKLGNLPQMLKHLPEQFRDIPPEEIQEALKIIFHDLVTYAFNFDLKKSKKRR